MKEEDIKNLNQKSKELAERIEAANKRSEELLEKLNFDKKKEIKQGETEAGSPTIEVSEEARKNRSAKEMLKGTGYDNMLFPEKGE